MISKEEMQQVLDYAQAKGAEFSELFLEDRSDQEVQCAKQQIQGIKNLRIYGAGLRLLQGTQEVYTYSSEVSLRGLMTLAEEALALLAGGAESKGKGKALKRMEGVNPNPVRLEVNASGVQKKDPDCKSSGAGSDRCRRAAALTAGGLWRYGSESMDCE